MGQKIMRTGKRIGNFLIGLILVIFGAVSLAVPFLPGIILIFIGIRFLMVSSARISWFMKYTYNKYKNRHQHRWLWKFTHKILAYCPVKIIK